MNVIEANEQFLSQFFIPGLRRQKPYSIQVHDVPIKLDQNEVPTDWPADLKREVCAALVNTNWNRYPSAPADELSKLLADYSGVSPECVITGPGTNQLIAYTLSIVTRKLSGRLVIARPSFPLYESHALVEGTDYLPWNLNEDLEYDLKLLPEMPPASVLIFASPNNPVGNVLPKADLARICNDHRESLIIADEAYFEFADEQYTDLLSVYSNLMIIRTCSKTMGAAGIRLGYALGSKAFISELLKARLPYMLNQFTLIAASMLLQPERLKSILIPRIAELREQRQRVYTALKDLSGTRGFTIKASQANFFLIKWKDPQRASKIHRRLIDECGILVRDISKAPGLSGCLRISLGSAEENTSLINAAKLLF
jgi:histidinol-phosphate aminotransferase